jgi:hypothetical protein
MKPAHLMPLAVAVVLFLATTDEQGEYIINGLWEGIWPVFFSEIPPAILPPCSIRIPVSWAGISCAYRVEAKHDPPAR